MLFRRVQNTTACLELGGCASEPHAVSIICRLRRLRSSSRRGRIVRYPVAKNCLKPTMSMGNFLVAQAGHPVAGACAKADGTGLPAFCITPPLTVSNRRYLDRGASTTEVRSRRLPQETVIPHVFLPQLLLRYRTLLPRYPAVCRNFDQKPSPLHRPL